MFREQTPDHSENTDSDTVLRNRMIHDCEDIIRETAGEEGVQYARNVWLDSLIDAPVSNNMQTWIDTAIEINMFFPGTLHSLLNTWERTYQAEVEFLDILQRQATD